MPPAKSSRNHDDSKADGPNSKEKGGNGHSSTKMRRGASQQNHSHLREVTNAATIPPPQPVVELSPPSLQWTAFERDILHAYRREHRLSTPSSFSNPYRQWILSQPNGIGLHSPTMVRRQQARRQSKDKLALAVRKHFNGMGVQENDVIVDFIYKIHHDTTRISKPYSAPTATTK
ncbi:hypothetical protein N0V84_001041 [Fusarium piperis]|uniref:Histone deacetylase complex subunit SAP30 Sin3 binding domain-containing protein n=1 Tax=Fusarium piperis TaxID=1435070 RepID=A0A9W8WLV4_9HYPO|nr:hypothetical protein N0V84_001041 [Fusarium piperis]